MSDYNSLPSLRSHVRTESNKDRAQLEKAGLEWVKTAAKNRLSYEIDWLGIPVIQTPEDLVLMQELIFKIKPDVLFETGIAHGGSLIFYASLMELLGKGKVIGVDIEIRPHNRAAMESHPLFHRIEMLEADSAAEETFAQVRQRIPEGSRVIVCLDSDHTKNHVLREMQLYEKLVTPGSYLVVFDTIASRLAAEGVADARYRDNGPKDAVDEFLANNRDFEIDKDFNKLFVSYSPDGYLKRMR